jgi:hypothetical protein
MYFQQPLGFEDLAHPSHVCLLRKSLYGLKQVPRAWFQRFQSFITMIGFSPSRCDSSLFIYKTATQAVYLLLYVDDIVLTASSSVLLHYIITTLSREFAMTDLGSLSHFLGVAVTLRSSSMFLS